MSFIKNLVCRQADFELNIPAMEWPDEGVSALTGPSGAGKSTLALSLSGLKPVEKSFQWIFKDRDLALLPPPKRNIALLPQSLALFPHISAEQNILFPAQARKMPAKLRKQRQDFLTASLHLAGFLKKPVGALSGGEKQRTALARALMSPSDFLILDEPFSALSAHLKSRAVELIREVARREDAPAVLLISHDGELVKSLANTVFYLERGRLAPPSPATRLIKKED